MKILIFISCVLVFVADAANSKRYKEKRNEPSDCPNECKNTPLDISFVVDSSASIWPENFTLGLNFIEDFVDFFTISPEAVRVSFVTFGEVVYTQDAWDFGAHTSNEELRQAIARVPYRSGVKTNTSGGIWYMLRQQLQQRREGVRHVVIVLTDGNSQETALTKQAAAEAREAGLEVFAIGVGHAVSAQELHNIASDNRHVFMVSEYYMLEDIKERLAFEACDKPTFPECKMDPVDLSFVIDSSRSIGQGNFTVGLAFVSSFLRPFQINPSSVRVSAVTYGRGVYTSDAFGFNTYKSKKDVLDAVAAIPYRSGDYTDTGAGIDFMLEQMKHARPEAAHIAIVITDGESQEHEKTKAEAHLAQNNGIVMYAVGVGRVGKELNQQELDDIAGRHDHVLTAANYRELHLLQKELTHITCAGIMDSLEQKGSKFRE